MVLKLVHLADKRAALEAVHGPIFAVDTVQTLVTDGRFELIQQYRRVAQRVREAIWQFRQFRQDG